MMILEIKNAINKPLQPTRSSTHSLTHSLTHSHIHQQAGKFSSS